MVSSPSHSPQERRHLDSRKGNPRRLFDQKHGSRIWTPRRSGRGYLNAVCLRAARALLAGGALASRRHHVAACGDGGSAAGVVRDAGHLCRRLGAVACVAGTAGTFSGASIATACAPLSASCSAGAFSPAAGTNATHVLCNVCAPFTFSATARDGLPRRRLRQRAPRRTELEPRPTRLRGQRQLAAATAASR